MSVRARALVAPAAVGGVSLVALVLGLTLAGFDASDALGSAMRGAFGSPYAVFSATLKRATPLLILGISVAVAFRAGVLNIGGEGQFLIGAAAGVATGLALPPATPAALMIALEFAAGILAGGAWAGLAAWLLRRFSVSEVVSTLLLNFVALNVVGFLIRGPMQEPSGSYPESAMLPESAQLPLLLSGQRLHLGFAIALVLAVTAWWFFRRTAAGFRFIVTGTSPTVAASAGLVNVAGERFRALLMSGAIAGVAGVSEAAGVTYKLYEGLSPGYGYTAIGVALLGGLSPGGTALAAVFFGALGAGADAMQRDAQVPAEVSSVIAAIVILGMLAVPWLARRTSRAAPGPGVAS